jgi:hypothetical protein
MLPISLQSETSSIKSIQELAKVSAQFNACIGDRMLNVSIAS